MKCLRECGLYLNQKYYDAERAIPTLLEKLHKIKLPDNTNKEEIGIYIKKYNLQYLYHLLESHTKVLCIINDGIAYNLDAFIAQYAKTLPSILNYRIKHDFSYILLSPYGYYGYDYLTKKLVRKGIYKKIPPKLLMLLTRLYLDKGGIEYIKYFDNLYMKLPNKYFINEEVLLSTGRYVDGKILNDNDNVDREFYLRLIIKYTTPYLELQF